MKFFEYKKTTSRMLRLILMFAFVVSLLGGCNTKNEVHVFRTQDQIQGEAQWTMGFGRCEIAMPLDESQPYYIAGYNQGWEPAGVLDLCNAQAVWMDAGAGGVLLIGVDCVGLGSPTVNKIRNRLQDLCEETGCTAVNVYSTHDHAGVDTLGLWGPVMVDGKNDEYMENVIEAAVTAAHKAAENKSTGKLYYGSVDTEALAPMLRDSRNPLIYDSYLHQLRFEPDKATDAGIRMYIYGAHAEALRGSNKMISRDFPGTMCDLIEEETGDHAMFMPGAIGGLLMTKEFTALYVNNMNITARKLANFALSIDEEEEILPDLQFARKEFEVPMDNTGYLFYKFLGVLDNEISKGESATGYMLHSEMTVLQLGDLLLALIPGEIFPELVWGGEAAQHNPAGKNPTPLAEIAASNGYDQLLVIGLANDELGYIVPPSDFLLNEEVPYLLKTMDDTGENHYEETNSVGESCAIVIAEIFEQLVNSLAL